MILLNEIRIIVTIALSVRINCFSVLESNGTAGKDLNAQMLIALGRELNNSLLTVIGKVIENYHRCTAWSQWNECGAMKLDFFSMRSRTRQCGNDASGQAARAEFETGICEGGNGPNRTVCPSTYNMTVNGFCLRLLLEGKSHGDAESLCNNDGGFLLHIDSDKKYDDVKSILSANDVTTQIYINGRRKTSASEWEYTYGSGSGYFHWFNGYPTKNARWLCLRLTGKRSDPDRSFRTNNFACDQHHPFLCEVPVL